MFTLFSASFGTSRCLRRRRCVESVAAAASAEERTGAAEAGSAEAVEHSRLGKIAVSRLIAAAGESMEARYRSRSEMVNMQLHRRVISAEE